MYAYLFVAITVVLTVASQVLQKQVAMFAVGAAGPVLLRYMRQPRFWMALSLLGVAMLSWLVVLHSLQVSKAYTLLSVNYALMVPVSRFLFAERIPPTRWAGALVISLGVVCISWS